MLEENGLQPLREKGVSIRSQLVWWSEFSKLRVETPKHSLFQTADLRAGTPIPRMDLDSPCVPVGWRVALSVDSDGEESVYYFGEVDLGPQVDMLHWVGR